MTVSAGLAKPDRMSTKIRFRLSLSSEEYLRYYQGQAHAVMVLAEDGRRIQLPANCFRPFVTRDGLQGRFEVELDANNKLAQISRIGS